MVLFGISLEKHKRKDVRKLRRAVNVLPILDVMRKGRLEGRIGHVSHREDNDDTKKACEMKTEW